MLYNIYANQEMGRIEKISGNAIIVFEAMKQLMALTYIEIIIINDERYYLIFNNLILENIPLFIKSKRTLSRAISELKDSDLIKYNENSNYPAYALTDKAISYITRFVPTDGGKVSLDENKKKKKQPLFNLSKPMMVSDLKKEYYLLLQQHCFTMCDKQNVPHDEFGRFIDYHSSKGTKFLNYIRAFSTWLRNYKKWNKNPNGADNTSTLGKALDND